MTWWEVEPMAKLGVPVRRSSWPATRSLVFKAGAGTTRAVAVLQNGSVESVYSFRAAEFQADDWQLS